MLKYQEFVLFFCALTILFNESTGQTTRNCITCASDNLKSKWYLTGLAQVPDSFFVPNCNNQANRIISESCSGPCFTMVFDNPDEVGCKFCGRDLETLINHFPANQVTPTTYVVRGCHRTLTNVITDRTDYGSNNNGSRFCEIDPTYRMADKKGNIVNVRMMSIMCSDRDLCNQDEFATDFTSGQTCANQTNNNCKLGRLVLIRRRGFIRPKCVPSGQRYSELMRALLGLIDAPFDTFPIFRNFFQFLLFSVLNNSPLNCYDCTPSEGNNCHESKCTKKYCSKQQVKLDGGFQLMKTCSNVNIYGVDNVCQTFDVFTNPGGVPVKSQYTQCYCKDKQFCNSSGTVSFLISLGLSIFSVFASLKLL